MTQETLEVSEQLLNEYDLFRNSVRALEERAADGAYGKPLRFLAGLEIEFGILKNDKSAAALEWYVQEKDNPDAMQKIREADLIVPRDATLEGMLPQDQCKELIDKMYGEATAFVHELVPKNDDERAKRQMWLKDIDNFTATDLINFLVYREFSNPTLGETAPKKPATHAEMTEYGVRSDWLEFRFGTGILQEGYYDNEGTCELRLTPCSPTELIEREEIVMDRIAQIAFPLGAIVRRGGRHVNLSAYHPSYEDGQWNWHPVIGQKAMNQATSIDAVAGLTAAIEDGVWMTKEKAKDYFMFGVVSGHMQLKITPIRSSIRIVDDYVELRDRSLMISTAHGLLWAMAGIAHGLEQGALQLLHEGHTLPGLQERHFVERTANFDKERDLQLQRALENAEPLEIDGPFKMSNFHNTNRGHRLATNILGKEIIGDDKNAAMTFNAIVFAGLFIEDGGKLSYKRGNFKSAYEFLTGPGSDGEYAKAVKPLVDSVGFDALEDAICTLIDRDAMRITTTVGIYSTPRYPALNPTQWQQRWKDSPIMKLAFGDRHEVYADELAKEAAINYREIDLRDPVQYAAVIKDLEARSQQHN